MEYLLLLIVLVAISGLSLYKHFKNRPTTLKAIKRKRPK